MNIHDKLTQINQQLRGKRPGAKLLAPKPASNKSSTTLKKVRLVKYDKAQPLKARIADMCKQVAAVFEQAKQLKARALYAPLNALGKQLAALEMELNKIS
jgi:hypothetical protein